MSTGKMILTGPEIRQNMGERQQAGIWFLPVFSVIV